MTYVCCFELHWLCCSDLWQCDVGLVKNLNKCCGWVVAHHHISIELLTKQTNKQHLTIIIIIFLVPSNKMMRRNAKWEYVKRGPAIIAQLGPRFQTHQKRACQRWVDSEFFSLKQIKWVDQVWSLIWTTQKDNLCSSWLGSLQRYQRKTHPLQCIVYQMQYQKLKVQGCYCLKICNLWNPYSDLF